MHKCKAAWAALIVTLSAMNGCDRGSGTPATRSADAPKAGQAAEIWRIAQSQSSIACGFATALSKADPAELRAATYEVPEPLERRARIAGKDIDLSVSVMRPLLEGVRTCVQDKTPAEQSRTLIALDQLLAGAMLSAAQVADSKGQGGSAWQALGSYRGWVLTEIEKLGEAGAGYEPAKKKAVIADAIRSLDARVPTP